MKISSIIKGIKDVVVEGQDYEIENISYNTSTIKENSLFFCIEGFKTDGHNYAWEACEKGAKAVVISKDIEVKEGVSKIRVSDTREAMAIMAGNFYGNPANSMDVIGITGTNGKTTSTYMLKSILDVYGKKTGLLGTIHNIIGEKIQEAYRTTPESMDLHNIFSQMKNNNVQSCIMEVSSHSLMLKRVHGIRFKAGIFTNLTQDHLDFHQTMDNYFNAKMILLRNCETAIINVDDEYGKRALLELENKVLTYGIDSACDVSAEEISISADGTKFILKYNGDAFKIKLHLPGKFNVYNALGCAAAAISQGIPLETVKEGLEALENVPGRSEKIISKNGYAVVIDYAHTPDGLINILKTVREYTKGRLITVFGCGGDRDRAKRPLMGKAAGSLSDFCIVTSDNPRSEEPRSIIEDILPGINETKCHYDIIVDRREAIKNSMDMAKQGDVVVIAGKGHETYQVLKDKTIHFDEKEIVLEILKEEK